MKPLHRQLLTEIHRLHTAHAKTKRPLGKARLVGAQMWMWDKLRDMGPKICDLFGGPASEAERRRVSRALQRMADLGLVELGSVWGKNVAHVKLTPAGMEAIK